MERFQEGATVGDGNPKIICSRCSLVLNHPSLGSGNNCMTNHINSESCKKTWILKGMKQLLEYSLSPIRSSSALQAAMTAISSHLRSNFNIMPSTVYLTGYESRGCALRPSDGILHA